jgi:alpha-L-fucosidase
MTMNGSWGHHAGDHNWKSARQLIRTLCETASKGGNFLLNVGPTAEGEIPQPCVERLQAIGRWMAVNGSAIRGTQASPFAEAPKWGRITSRAVTDAGGRAALELNLLVFEWPTDGKLRMPSACGGIRAARLLAGGAALAYGSDEQGAFVAVPSAAPDQDVAVAQVLVEKP